MSAFEPYEFHASVCGDRKVLKLTADEADEMLQEHMAALEAELEPHRRHATLVDAGWTWLIARGYAAPSEYGHGRRCFSQSEAWKTHKEGPR